MKILSTTAVLLVGSTCSAFSPAASRAAVCGANTCPTSLHMNVPFFAQDNSKTDEATAPAAPAPVETKSFDQMTLEDEIDYEVQKELAKNAKISNLRNENGVEFAPWMGVSEEDKKLIIQAVTLRTKARRRQSDLEKEVSGNLLKDSQAQELSGTGLTYKFIDGKVELEWATRSEKNTKGFLVKRRKAKTDNYETVASFEDWGPLASKGPDGGIYRFFDETVTPGGWVYRITEVDNNGSSADICQCLVEIQTEDEQRAATIAGVGFAVFAVLAVVAGIAADPYGGY
mmetsp:Transcript_1438/g.2998  ORF Transcript_1438/g.2998 Transcript_1438/m.2998 type:complete len:286 (-) Transcript_1438:111-968(-)